MLLWLLFALFNLVQCKECLTRSSIEQSLLDAHIPGAVIVVVNKTDILYQDAFGHQSFLPIKLMNVEKSIFVLASISKTFMAIAIMQLVELNLLDLDTDINQYLLPTDLKISNPFYPTHSITLRHLLSHSSSIGNNFQMESLFFQSDDKALTETTLAEACFTFLNPNISNWLPYPPGTVTLYSNVGSGLAGLIIERITNISYEQYIREKILKPLNIDVKQAGFRLTDIEDQTNLVKHYAFNSSPIDDWKNFVPQLNVTETGISKWISIPFYSVSVYPAGLLRMSAHSLSIYLRMFMNNGLSLISPQSIIQMQTVVSNAIPYQNINGTNAESLLPPIKFGIIWNWQTLEKDRRFLGHDGSMPGATNSMLINEKGDLGVIIFTNGDVYPQNDISINVYLTVHKLRLALFNCFEN